MADNNFKGTVEALFQGMDAVISSRTVVGDAIHINDTIILPLVDVSFAVGAGAFNGDKSGEKKRKRCRWSGRQDDSQRCPCHPEWHDASCKYQEPGYHHQNPGHGSGCAGPFHFQRKWQDVRGGPERYSGRSRRGEKVRTVSSARLRQDIR